MALKDLVELVVPLQTPPEVRQLLPKVEQLPKWTYLARNGVRREIVEALERQVDTHFGLVWVVGEFVVDFEGQMRFHPGEHFVEVVWIDVDELPVLEPGHLLGGVTGQVGEDAHHEGDFLQLNGVTHLDVVRDMDAWGTHPLKFSVNALGHGKNSSADDLIQGAAPKLVKAWRVAENPQGHGLGTTR